MLTKGLFSKKFMGMTFVGLFLVMSAMIIVGCAKENLQKELLTTDFSRISDEIKADATSYYGKVVMFSDFPMEKLLTEKDLQRLNEHVSTGDVGGSAENALVPLIFDQNGVLYTALRYNTTVDHVFEKAALEGKEVDGIPDMIEEYYTDLQTFRRVTDLPQATTEYVIPVPNNNGDLFWSFDPYVKFFESRE